MDTSVKGGHHQGGEPRGGETKVRSLLTIVVGHYRWQAGAVEVRGRTTGHEGSTLWTP
jgi:hypothetical protein